MFISTIIIIIIELLSANVYMINDSIYIRLEKHLQCEKLLGLARGTTKKRGNKKSDESITPIRYCYVVYQ